MFLKKRNSFTIQFTLELVSPSREGWYSSAGSSVDGSGNILQKDNGDNAGGGWAHTMALATRNLSTEETETEGSGVQGSLELQQGVQGQLELQKNLSKIQNPKINNEGSCVRKRPYNAFTKPVLLFPGKETEAQEC